VDSMEEAGRNPRVVRERRTGSRIVLEHRFADAMVRAGNALAEISGEPLTVHSSELRRHTAGEILELAGGPEAVVVAVYVGISGPLSGHALMLLHPTDARRLARLLLDGLADLDSSDGSGSLYQPDPLERSALEETGNVVIANFLNAFAPIDLAETIHVSVPESVVDMAGAILDGILIDLSSAEDTFLVESTAFHSAAGRINLTLLVLPRLATLADFSHAEGYRRAVPAGNGAGA